MIAPDLETRMAVYQLMLEEFEDCEPIHPCSGLCAVLERIVNEWFLGYQTSILFYDELWDQRTVEDLHLPWFAFYDSGSRMQVLKNAIEKCQSQL